MRRAQPKPFWEAPPTLEEEPEDGSADVSTQSDSLVPNLALQSLTGTCKFSFRAYPSNFVRVKIRIKIHECQGGNKAI